jgi:cyanophycin synthetase
MTSTNDSGQAASPRAIIYRVGPGYALIEAQRDLSAFRAAGELAVRSEPRQCCAVASVPGDIADPGAVLIGRLMARSFHRIVLKDDRDRRGRQPFEIPLLLAEAVLDVRPLAACTLYQDERRAISQSIEVMAPNEIVFIFAEDAALAHATVKDRGGHPTGRIDALPPRPVRTGDSKGGWAAATSRIARRHGWQG